MKYTIEQVEVFFKEAIKKIYDRPEYPPASREIIADIEWENNKGSL